MVILNIDDAASFAQLSSKLAVQTGYEKQIQDCNDEKRHSYERFLLKEIDLDAYRAEKAEYDLKLNNLNRLHTTIASVTAQMQSTGEDKAKRKKLAHGIITETKLTQELADTLIDKVYIYPENRIEIVWKIRAFAGETAESERVSDGTEKNARCYLLPRGKSGSACDGHTERQAVPVCG